MKNNITIKNKKAYFDYFIEEEYVAGISLIGGEIKSIRNGNVSITEAFCYVTNNNEIFLKGSYVKLYEHCGYIKYDERRDRKLLLNKIEIRRIIRALKDKGKTIVPLIIFMNEKGLCKVKIAVCKGKHNFDKRNTIKERDIQRELNKQ